ncbi:MAG: repeat-containing protein [Chthonomonadaceae bacterium]|nr:repeat-containing protein [Chthonomonadaceae bacterium]
MDLLQLCEVLGVQPGASASEVKAAYRDLVQVWHPDRFGQSTRLNTLATEKLKEINEAYSRLMELATPSGYVPKPPRPTQRPDPAPPKPQPPSPPRPQQQADPVHQSAPVAQSREPAKLYRARFKIFVLLIVCVLGYFSALSIEEAVEYRFLDHPRALCGNWNWQRRNGSGLTLYEDGSGFSSGEGGSTRTHIHWKCRDGIMRVYAEINPRFTDTLWTEWRIGENGDLICTNQGRGQRA